MQYDGAIRDDIGGYFDQAVEIMHVSPACRDDAARGGISLTVHRYGFTLLIK